MVIRICNRHMPVQPKVTIGPLLTEPDLLTLVPVVYVHMVQVLQS